MSTSVDTVLLVERDGKVGAELYRGSAGSATVPVGAVATGGAAPARPVDPVLVLAGLLLTAVACGLLGRAGSRAGVRGGGAFRGGGA